MYAHFLTGSYSGAIAYFAGIQGSLGGNGKAKAILVYTFHMARPSSFTQQLAAELCAQIAEGKSLRTICASGEMPAVSTIFVWLNKHPEFQEQYARAKEQQADAFIEDMLSISDDSEHDYVGRVNEQGKEYRVVDQEAINRSRLRVDTRKWIASKLKAKVYGDRIQQNISGPNGEPMHIRVTGVDGREDDK